VLKYKWLFLGGYLMDTLYIVFAGIGAVVLIIILVLILSGKKKDKPKEIEFDELRRLITSGEVKKIDFIRNKIVLYVKDGNTFDVEKLHKAGVKGMQVVGDKIKFYFDGDRNEEMFYQMKSWLEV
jgi:hypothetical protein